MTTEAIPVPSLGEPEPTADIPPLAQEQEQLVEPELPPRPTRRSRRKTAAPPPSPEPIQAPVVTQQEKDAIAAALGFSVKILLDYMASRRGDHWKASDDEQRMLGELWTNAIPQSWYNESAKYAPLAMAVVGTAGVVLPRLQRDQQLAEQLQQQEPGQTTSLGVVK